MLIQNAHNAQPHGHLNVLKNYKNNYDIGPTFAGQQTSVFLSFYTQKSKYWIGYLFLLDVMYKKYLIEPSHKNYLQLKVL